MFCIRGGGLVLGGRDYTFSTKIWETWNHQATVRPRGTASAVWSVLLPPTPLPWQRLIFWPVAHDDPTGPRPRPPAAGSGAPAGPRNRPGPGAWATASGSWTAAGAWHGGNSPSLLEAGRLKAATGPRSGDTLELRSCWLDMLGQPVFGLNWCRSV